VSDQARRHELEVAVSELVMIAEACARAEIRAARKKTGKALWRHMRSYYDHRHRAWAAVLEITAQLGEGEER
jgi:hypothetical protein